MGLQISLPWVFTEVPVRVRVTAHTSIPAELATAVGLSPEGEGSTVCAPSLARAAVSGPKAAPARTHSCSLAQAELSPVNQNTVKLQQSQRK